jgi:hypothetical protein
MERHKRRRRGAGGFTLIETFAAMALMTIGFLGFYATIHASSRLRETADETNIAVFKLQTVAEHIYSIPFDDVTAAMPDGGAVDLTALVDSLPENDFSLMDEQVRVTYDDPFADPLRFNVAITWTSRLGGARAEHVAGMRAR